MTFENDRPVPDGDDITPDSSAGDDSPIDRASAEAWESIEPTDADRFELGIDDAPVGNGETSEEERSRVDGMPEGWLDGPADLDVAIDLGPDPLAVTTSEDDPEASGVSHSSRVQIGTGQSGIASPSDVGSSVSPPEERLVRTLAQEIPDEEAVWPAGTDPLPEEELHSGAEKTAEEWRDIVATVRDDMPSESIGFGAFVGEAEVVDPAIADSYHGDSQGIDESHGETIDVGALSAALPPAVASGGIVTSGPRSKRAGGGLGQMVGVVIGGVLAIPVTLAILLFGFQRDPLHITPKVPDGLRFLLPSRFRSVGEERRTDKTTGGPGRLTLDQIPTPDSAATAAVEPDPEPAVPPAPAATIVDEAELVGGAIVTASDAPADDVGGAERGLPASLPPHPIDEVELVVDPVSVDAGSVGGEPGRKAEAIELAPVAAAISAATSATDSLGEGGGPGGDPTAREQSLVGWYRSLSLVALELAKAERAAIESGRSSSEVIDRFAELRSRLAIERHDDLELLGSMWLASEKRPSDGAILVATLEAVRPVGPWWGGRLAVGGEAPHGLSFLARSAPMAQPGDAVIVVGVLGESGTIWAVDIGTLPAVGKAADDAVDPSSF